MTPEDCDLTHLLAPLDPARFFSEHWERAPLHLERDDPNYYPRFFSLDDLERYLLSQSEAETERVLVVPPPGDERERERCSPADRGPAHFLSSFAQGDTLVLNQAHRVWPPLAALCARLGEELSLTARANLYLTPAAGAQGFDVHHDLHDVLVLQLEGRKRWRLYAPWAELPLDRPEAGTYDHRPDPFARPEDPGPPRRELETKPGDLLYLPRGLPHAAVSADERPSVHATVGLHPFTWGDALHHALRRLEREDPHLRRALPPGFLRRPEGFPALAAELRDLAARFAAGLDAEAALAKLDELHLASRPFVPARRAALGAPLTEDSELARRLGLRCAVFRDEDDDAVVLYFGDNHVRGPAWLEAAFHYVAKHERLQVRDLPDSLSPRSKLVLARRLVREGLLLPVR
ncbi:MAG: hypothetical protein D6731_21720 [Planctomycetota bacterium]|nr:MAG: hypothetical protein D6731_21720 [Planctomycetota bacterium]